MALSFEESKKKFMAQTAVQSAEPMIMSMAADDDEAFAVMADSASDDYAISGKYTWYSSYRDDKYSSIDELKNIKATVKPTEIILVVDAMTGQDAVNTAKQFNDRLDFDGVVLTKLDGDTRGGAAISIRAVVNKPLKFISSGEKMDALQVFHPERMADRILGMGDIVSLVERAQEQYDEQEARRLKKKLVRDQFNFNDFLSQIAQIKKMGNLKDLASMIPGVGKALKNVEISDDVFKQTEAIIQSMTPAERENPSILNGSRKQRIAAGSGTTIQEVNRLLKQFEDTRKMMKTVAGGMPKMMRHGKRR